MTIDKASQQFEQLLALPKHLLEFLQASHRSPPRKSELIYLLQQDPALLANLIEQQGAPSLGHNDDAELLWLQRWLDAIPLPTLRYAAITACSPFLTSRLDNQALLTLRNIHADALRVAELAPRLANLLPQSQPDEAQLTGLMHNIGKLVLLSRSVSDFVNSAIPVCMGGASCAAEANLFGESHLDAAINRLSRWQLDSFITEAIANVYDNGPQDSDTPLLFALLRITLSIVQADAAADHPLPELLANAGVSDASWRATLSQWRHAVSKNSWIGLDNDTFCAVQREALHNLGVLMASLCAGQTRQLALMTCTDRDDLLEQSAALLQSEDICTAVFFLLSDDQRLLRGTPLSSQPRRLSQLQAKVESGTSLVAQALVSDEVLDSFSTESFALGVFDQQLLKLMGTQGYCCVPLSYQEQPLGTLVLGMRRIESLSQLTDPGLNALLETLCAKLFQFHVTHRTGANQHDSALLAREIFHELSSPVSAIRNYLYVLKREANDTTREALQQVETETGRISEILLNFRQRALNEIQADEQLDINALVRETASRVVKQSSFQGQLETDLDGQIARIKTNRTALQQILTNLLGNAIDACGAQGQIRISTRGGWIFNQQRYLALQIQDNGSGIPDAIQRQLFKPVTSSKGAQHAGLGLSIVAKLVSDIHGLVSVQSNHHGTSFQILLPEVSR